jgi:hypothetical protein
MPKILHSDRHRPQRSTTMEESKRKQYKKELLKTFLNKLICCCCCCWLRFFASPRLVPISFRKLSTITMMSLRLSRSRFASKCRMINVNPIHVKRALLFQSPKRSSLQPFSMKFSTNIADNSFSKTDTENISKAKLNFDDGSLVILLCNFIFIHFVFVLCVCVSVFVVQKPI